MAVAQGLRLFRVLGAMRRRSGEMAEQDQTAVAPADQTTPVEEQRTDAVSPDASESVPAGSEAVPFDYGQITDDWIKDAAAKSESLKGYLERQRLDGENIGKQRRDRELRLERGSEETAAAWQERIAQKYGVSLDDEDRKAAPLWVKANRDVERVNAARKLVETVSEAFEVGENERIAQAMELIADDPEQMETVALQITDAALSRRSSRQIADLTLDAIPKDSALWKSVQEHIATEAGKELEARMAEQEPAKVNPPRTSTGQPAGSIEDQWQSMTREQRIEFATNADQATRDRLWAMAAPGR